MKKAFLILIASYLMASAQQYTPTQLASTASTYGAFSDWELLSSQSALLSILAFGVVLTPSQLATNVSIYGSFSTHDLIASEVALLNVLAANGIGTPATGTNNFTGTNSFAVTINATNGIATWSSNTLAPASIVISSNAFKWTNTLGKDMSLYASGQYIDGGINGVLIYTNPSPTSSSANYFFHLLPNDWIILHTNGSASVQLFLHP